MKRLAILIAATLLGCAPRDTRPIAKSPPAAPKIVLAPSNEMDAPEEKVVFREPITLPGCDDRGVAALKEKLEALNTEIGWKGPLNVEHALTEIHDAWRHPCLSHLARIFPPPPRKLEKAALGNLWTAGLHGTLLAMNGALYVRDGKRYFIVPPSAPDPVTLTASEKSALAPWLCPAGDARCGRAPAFMARAESVFNREEQLVLRWHAVIVGGHGQGDPMPNSFLSSDDACAPRKHSDEDEPPTMTPFEELAVCLAIRAPRTWRYPKDVKLRARESGWLVMRGRRGHYSFADEVRAYDLATGAAYVARSESALVLAGPSVDFDAVDKKRKPAVIVGSVSAEQARELAFVLATGSLVRASRSEVQLVPVPKDLPVTFTTGRGFDAPFAIPENEWGSSAHTSIAWSLVENGQTIASGDLMWPSAWRATENHADELLSVLEAGLAKGCAPARLPAGIARGAHGKVSAIDADPDAQHDVFADLAKQLESVTNVCR